MFDAIKFFSDYNVQFIQGGHKHARPGWIQIRCPFCTGTEGWHLGYCTDANDRFAEVFSCWRCGGKDPVKVVKAITGKSYQDSKKIYKKYKGKTKSRSRKPEKASNLILPIKWPAGTTEIKKVASASKYLIKRRYDPKALEIDWGIKATRHLGPYAFRVMVPVLMDGLMVSYQGRDYTGKAPLKYKAANKKVETIHHKNIVGGFYQAKKLSLEHIIIVEGFFDAFRFGPGAVCLFGISYRPEQVRFIARHFKGVTVIFDGEPQARAQAKKICNELAIRGLSVKELILDAGDPGELPENKAKKIKDKFIR